MEQAFYMKVNEFVQSIDVEKQNKYLIKTQTYNEVVQILTKTEEKHQSQLKFWAKKTSILSKLVNKIFYTHQNRNYQLLPMKIYLRKAKSVILLLDTWAGIKSGTK